MSTSGPQEPGTLGGWEPSAFPSLLATAGAGGSRRGDGVAKKADEGSKVKLRCAMSVSCTTSLLSKSYSEPTSGEPTSLPPRGPHKFSCSCSAAHDTRFLPQWECSIFTFPFCLLLCAMKHVLFLHVFPSPHTRQYHRDSMRGI